MSNETVDYIKIPKERVGVLIGKNGATKSKIERYLGIHLDVESDEGLVTITIPENPKDPLAVLKIKNIVTAIGRGFSPRDALYLLEDTMLLQILDLSQMDLTEKARQRQKGRIIGRDGRMKTSIEKNLSVKISIYGKTVAIIGERESVTLAKTLIERLISGTPHSAIFHMLEKKKNARDILFV